jgi:hypothetical protein
MPDNAEMIFSAMNRTFSQSYDVFISYRREGGAETARLLRTELEDRGYRVFIDVENLQQGHYDEALLRNIEASRSFIVVLNPGALDRCVNEGDWLRVEIAHALKMRRKVVPVLMPGFKFPEPASMPEEMRELPRHQSVDYEHRYFDATLSTLCAYIGSPSRKNWWSKLCLRTKVLTVAAIVVVAGVSGVASVKYFRHPAPAPITQQDINLLTSLANDMCGQLTLMNNQLNDVKEMGRRASKAMEAATPDPEQLKDIADECRHLSTQADKARIAPMWQGGHDDDLNRLGIPAEDVHAFYSMCIPSFWDDLKNYYDMLNTYATMPEGARLGSEGRQIELDMETIQLDVQSNHYGLLGLFSHFPPAALKDFQKFKAQWTNLSDEDILTDEKAEALTNKTLLRLQDILTETASLKGNGEVKLVNAKNELKKVIAEKVQQDVANDPEIVRRKEELAKKAEYRDQLEAALVQKKTEVEMMKADLAEKCRIKPEDNLYQMWYKVLKLHIANMQPEMQAGMDRIKELQGAKEPDLDTCFRAAKAFWAAPGNSDGAGVMVMFFENNTPHSVLRRGDIILSMNGAKLRCEEDFIHAPQPPQGQSRGFDFLRIKSDGTFESLHGVRSATDPRIAVVDLQFVPKPAAEKTK